MDVVVDWGVGWGLWPPNSNSGKILVQCT